MLGVSIVLFVVLLAVLFAVAAVTAGFGDLMKPVFQDARPVGLPTEPVRPDDLEALRFNVVLRGYKMAEVDAVLHRMARELAERDAVLAELRGERGFAGFRPPPPVSDEDGPVDPLEGADPTEPIAYAVMGDAVMGDATAERDDVGSDLAPQEDGDHEGDASVGDDLPPLDPAVPPVDDRTIPLSSYPSDAPPVLDGPGAPSWAGAAGVPPAAAPADDWASSPLDPDEDPAAFDGQRPEEQATAAPPFAVPTLEPPTLEPPTFDVADPGMPGLQDPDDDTDEHPAFQESAGEADDSPPPGDALDER